ncbi:GNAT family N-acetyltransferase [Microbacterium aoyamense]|uniref:GNAT family N-acetyltransferase n=1 Tax=Microbacterium aoyamense TaxID=344166 RepID=A0ABP5AZX8_9MICO|nr:GNAT family N-acetyltransferase [Microbacterium aoyamense]
MQPVTLRTERLVLSLPTAGDIDEIYAACQDPDIQRYTTVPSPYERKHAEGFVPHVATSWQAGTELTWAIRDGSTLAGLIGLYRVANGAGEIGYWMAPESRGRGLLTEAALAVVDWGFDELDLQRIEWRAVVGNTGSARAAQKLGFTYEGMLRQALSSPRGRDDGWIAGLLTDDDRTPKPWPVLEA